MVSPDPRHLPGRLVCAHLLGADPAVQVEAGLCPHPVSVRFFAVGGGGAGTASRRLRRQSSTVPDRSKVISQLTSGAQFGTESPVPSRMKFCPTCAAPLGARDSEGSPRLACTSPDCDYVFYDNPVPVVAALLEHGETVLLVRNKGWPEKWYGLVTGFLEKGESPEEGVLREVKEELGLKGEIVSLIGVYPFAEMNQVILAYHVRGHGEITVGDEIAGVKAVPPDKLRPWPLGTGHAVRDWLAARGGLGPTVA